MAEMKVDNVRFHLNKGPGMFQVWVFNDERFYDEKMRSRIARYDFGRRPDHADGTPADRKAKLLIGLYREPYRDGWKYILNAKLHPEMYKLVLKYISYGWKESEDGDLVPFTYLRHNRKALGIHYLFERYVAHCKHMKKRLKSRSWCDEHADYRDGFSDYTDEPYFPTPQSYKGFNIATKWYLKK